MNEKRPSYPLDELASFEVKEDRAQGQFVTTIRGDTKCRHMVAAKVGELASTDDDFKQWEGE
jgi:hypothetical protein